MPEIRPILYVLGLLLTALGVAMAIPAFVDFMVEDIDWVVFAVSGTLTCFTGISLILSFRTATLPQIRLKEAFLLTVAAWSGTSAFAAIPFVFSNLSLTYTDAVFEAVSGVTTTGATVLTHLGSVHSGVLLWRSILQWIGGIGIIVTAIALLPLLKVGGMQLFRTESSDRSDKVLPTIRQSAGALFYLYFGFTFACALAYWASGMSAFDAINHAMTTLSTGGYSTSDASFAKFPSPLTHWIAVVFMLIGGMTFNQYVRMLHGDRLALWHDHQARWFVGIITSACVVLTAWLVLTKGMSIGTAIRLTVFNVVSVVTTTGYVSTDYNGWGNFAVASIFFLTFVGGCTGSTAGGIKIFRFQVLFAVARQQLRRLIIPHVVSVAMVQGREVNEQAALSVLAFFFFYASTFAVGALALGLFGLDPVTALSGAATAIGNVGPGLGDIIGPTGNFSSLPDGAKWVLSAGMLLGRLEFVTVFVLLTAAFRRS